MTEDEAKTKWCPFGFPSSHPGSNRWSQGHQDGEDARCIASACMAWRTGEPVKTPASVEEIAAHMARHGVGPLDASAATSRMVATGYCGLAGSP